MSKILIRKNAFSNLFGRFSNPEDRNSDKTNDTNYNQNFKYFYNNANENQQGKYSQNNHSRNRPNFNDEYHLNNQFSYYNPSNDVVNEIFIVFPDFNSIFNEMYSPFHNDDYFFFQPGKSEKIYYL